MCPQPGALLAYLTLEADERRENQGQGELGRLAPAFPVESRRRGSPKQRITDREHPADPTRAAKNKRKLDRYPFGMGASPVSLRAGTLPRSMGWLASFST